MQISSIKGTGLTLGWLGLVIGFLRLAVAEDGTRPDAIAVLQGADVEGTGSPESHVVHHAVRADRFLGQQDRLQAGLRALTP